MTEAALKPRERDAMVQALRAGVVPKFGLRHIQVGRAREIEEMIRDIERIADGGASVRFIIGEYGSGKTFFENLTRQVAIEKGLVAMSADLNVDRRLHATGGQARSLYSELARNVSTRTKPDGGAMASIVERFVSQARSAADGSGAAVGDVIGERLAHLEEFTGGYDFAEVVRRYWEGHESGDEELSHSALRWLRGEFATRTDARKALGVRTIVDDAGVYDHLKLMAAFVREAGYKGLIVTLDEMVNLYKLPSAQARKSNYEQILRIVNDVLQGGAEGIGFLMGGTPEFLMNTRRGLYSYEALQTRLAENSFARDGLVDFSGPVVRLDNLSREDVFVLLSKVRDVVQAGDPLPDDGIKAFMEHCASRIGDAYFRTPRSTVTAFANLLSVLEQNPDADWRDLVKGAKVEADGGEDLSDAPDEEDGELAGFEL